MAPMTPTPDPLTDGEVARIDRGWRDDLGKYQRGPMTTPDPLRNALGAPRHSDACVTCAKPRTVAGRKLLSQFHGWPTKKEYPWNLLDAADIQKIEAEAAALPALDAAWVAAEAALPKGWCDLMLYHFDAFNTHTPNSYGAKTISPDGREVYGYGETPAAALTALIFFIATTVGEIKP